MFDTTDFNFGLTPIERRDQPRQRSYLHGKLLYLTSSLSGDCTIRNFSKAGAMIKSDGLPHLPTDPIVVITKTGIAYETLTIWGRDGEVGVKFRASHDLS